MKYDTQIHGRASRTNNTRDWARAEAMSKSHPGPGEWVPWAAVWVHDGPSARLEAVPDTATVERYAGSYYLLPPITVQKDTFALIDGKHRLHAAPKAGSDFIRIVELDIPDDQILDESVKSNVSHGREMSQKERLYWAKDFLKRHRDWSDNRISEWTGASRDYVMDERRKLDRKDESKEQHVAELHVEPADEKRLGTDGTWRKVRQHVAQPHVAPRPTPVEWDGKEEWERTDEVLSAGVTVAIDDAWHADGADDYTLEDQGESLAVARAQLESSGERGKPWRSADTDGGGAPIDTEESLDEELAAAFAHDDGTPVGTGPGGGSGELTYAPQPDSALTASQSESGPSSPTKAMSGWYEFAGAIHTLALADRDGIDPRTFLDSVATEPGIFRDLDDRLAAALRWLKAVENESVFA